MYDIILYNNSTKDTTLIGGLFNYSQSKLYYQFNDIELDLPSGEYTYFLIHNDRNDVNYEFKDVPLNSIVHIGEEMIFLRDLEPETGLLKIVDEESEGNEVNEANKPVYVDRDTSYKYYKRG